MTAIVVLNWNGLDDTVECILSILEHTKATYHLYVIDNASERDELAEIEARFEGYNSISFIQNDTNFGFCNAHIEVWAKVIQHKPYDYMALINNDTAVSKNWLYNMIQCAQSHEAAIVSSKMVLYQDRNIIDNLGHRVISTGEIVPIANLKNEKDYTHTFINQGACAGGALYSTLMLKNIGFFDPYFDTGYEDAEFGARATVLGYKSVFCPDAKIYHKGGASIKKVFNLEYAIRNQINVLYSFFKLFPLWQVLIYTPLIIVKSIIVGLLGILFLRINFTKVTFLSLIRFFTQGHYSTAVQKRKATFKGRKRINSFKFYLNQKSFLSFHLYRAFQFLIRRKPSALEQYR